MEKVLAIILASGRGKRMDILCHERPKAALPFAGAFRLIDFSLSNCIHSRISHIAVLTDYQYSNMVNYLKRWHLMNTSAKNFHILPPKVGLYKGTADAVYQNLDYLRGCGTEAVLILPGDHVYKMDYRNMLAFHEQVKAEVTVGVVAVPIERARRLSIVTTDTKARIVDFVEKPWITRNNLASMGIYVFNREILSECLIEDAARSDSSHDFGYAITTRIVNRDRVFAYKFNGYWQDIDTERAYYEANMELTRQKSSLSLDDGWPIFAKDNNLPPPVKSQQGNVKNSFLSGGCMIKGHVENSILSPGVCVEDQAVVINSVLMENAFVGYRSVVDSCILDEGVNVGRFSYIGFGAALTPVQRGITVLGKGVTVPPHTAIGHNCKVLPYVTPADFPTKSVPSGTIVSQRSQLNNTRMLAKGGGR